MSYENVEHPKLFMIRRIKDGAYIRTGHRKHSHLEPSKTEGIPRLFSSETQAKQSLRKWCMGIHSFHYEDGIEVRSVASRKYEDFEIIEVELITEYNDEAI